LTYSIYFSIFYGVKKLLQSPLNPSTLKLISDIAAFRQFWDLSNEKERDLYGDLKKTTIITSAGSSTRIEGARLTDGQIRDRLEDLQIKKIQNRDEAEVAGYIDTLKYIFDHFSELEISEHTIRSLHQMMCRYLSHDILPPHQRGSYKDVVNSVVRIDHQKRTREVIFETTPPGIQTETEMTALVSDYLNYINNPNFSSLEVIAAFIVKFLAIHPFRDGNGRLSRLLTNLCLLHKGHDFCMYSSHEKVIEDNKNAYYVALRQTQSSYKKTCDINPWLMFFLQTLNQQTVYLKHNVIPKKAGSLTVLEEKTIDLIRFAWKGNEKGAFISFKIPPTKIKVSCPTGFELKLTKLTSS
jgi:Fic family protein